ncbi:MAG: hypothetical protein C0462_11805 [Alcanivorax sp.]|nr:hypothetical protein [Alcanivorax sp.]
MYLNNYGVDAVLQLSRNFLKEVMVREAYTRAGEDGNLNAATLPNLVDASGELGIPLPESQGAFRYDNLNFRYRDVNFVHRNSDHTSFAVVTIERASGELLYGNSMTTATQPVDTIDLWLRLAVDNEASTSTRLVIRTSLDPAIDQLIDLFNLDIDISQFEFTFPFELGGLSMGGQTLTLGNPAGAIKALPDGSLAIGLNIRLDGQGEPGINVDTFRQQYTANLLSGGQDWGLSVSRWPIARFVEQIELSSQVSGVENTGQQLDSIDSNGIHISGYGSYDASIGTWGFTFDATATFNVENPGASNSRVVADWTLENVELDSFFGSFLDGIFGFIDSAIGDDGQGNVEILNPASFSSGDGPTGALHVLEARTADARVDFLGQGEASAIADPLMQVNTDSLALGPACGGGFAIGTVTVSNPATSNDTHAPLTANHHTLEGDDAEAFRFISGEQSVVLQAGAQHQVRVGRANNSGDGYHEAELVIRTNAGEKRVALSLYQGHAALAPLPDTLEMDASERRNWCEGARDQRVSKVITLQATGTGAVRVCNVQLTGAGGQWSLSGIQSGDLIPAGEQRQVTLTFAADELDAWHNATLTLNTQPDGAQHQMAITARVRSAARGYMPPGTVIDGLDFAAFGLGGTRLCFRVDDLGRALDFIDRINKDFHGIWGGVEPICCPPPQQPMCLCQDWLSMDLMNLPPGGARIHGGNGALLDQKLLGGSDRIMAPVAHGEAPTLALDIRDTKGHTFEGHMRRWVVSRPAGWTQDAPVDHVTAAGGRIALTSGASLTLLSLDEKGGLQGGDPMALREPPLSLGALGARLLISDRQGLQWLDPASPASKPMPIEAPAFNGLLTLNQYHGKPGHYLVGLQAGHLQVLDLRNPQAPRIIDRAEVSGQPDRGQLAGQHMVLASQNTVEILAWQQGRLRSLGATKVPIDVASMVSNGVDVWVLDSKGAGHVLRLTDDGLAMIGSMTLPEKWRDGLPHGGFSALDGKHWVAGRLDRRGCNVYTVDVAAADLPGKSDRR